jgi:MFS family permease
MEKWKLASLSLSMLLASLGVSIPNVALPSMAKDFGVTFSEIQYVILSYLIAMTAMIVVVGRFGDRWGRRKILLIGISLFAFGALLCAMAPNIGLLISARVIQGFGAATIMALSVALASDIIAKEKVGRAMGLMGTMSAIGTASGPTVGGLVLAAFDWRSLFFLMSVLGFLIFVFSYLGLPKLKTKDKTLSAALNIIRMDLLRNVELSSHLLMNFIVATVMMSTLVVGPFYLSLGLQLNTNLVGFAMSVGPLMSIITGVPAGYLADYVGPAKATKVGLILMALGTAALCFLPDVFGITGFIISVAILSPGYQFFQAANNTSFMMSVPSGERGIFSGLLSLSRNLGLITGTSAMGAIFASYSGSVASGKTATFAVASALVLLALSINVFLTLNPNRKEKNETQLT